MSHYKMWKTDLVSFSVQNVFHKYAFSYKYRLMLLNARAETQLNYFSYNHITEIFQL